MRIGIVCYPTVGGSGVVATEMALALAQRGHDVHLLSYDRPGRLGDGDRGVTFHRVQVSAYPLFRYPPYDLALATRMLEVQEEHGIELFHVHYAIPHAVSAFLARSMGCPQMRFVTTLHGTDITVVGADPAYMRPTRFAIQQSNAVTAVSAHLAEQTRSVFGSTTPIEIVPNFVDTDHYRPRGAAWHQRTDAERILVHASNFRPVKRVADIVRAFALIRRTVPARLLLAGDGPDREHAMAVAADLGCIGHIDVLGVRDGTSEVLQGADLFLSASETESFGLSMLEAMACGVPCVSTDVGGVREVLGETGALVPMGQPERLAGAALKLLRDPELHARHAAMSRERAVACFARDAVVARYIDLYERVLVH